MTLSVDNAVFTLLQVPEWTVNCVCVRMSQSFDRIKTYLYVVYLSTGIVAEPNGQRSTRSYVSVKWPPASPYYRL